LCGRTLSATCGRRMAFLNSMVRSSHAEFVSQLATDRIDFRCPTKNIVPVSWIVEIGVCQGFERDLEWMSADRQRSGCLTCRARKVRCDSKEGVCERCRRLSLECARLNGSSLSPKARVEMSLTAKIVPGLNQAGFKRIRVTSSCLNCRHKKMHRRSTELCPMCPRRTRMCIFRVPSSIHQLGCSLTGAWYLRW